MKEIYISYFISYIWATQRTRLAPRQLASLSPNVCGGCTTHSPPATALITNSQAPFPPPCVPLPSPCPCTTVYAAGPGVYRPRVCVPIASMIAPPRSVRPNLPRPTYRYRGVGCRSAPPHASPAPPHLAPPPASHATLSPNICGGCGGCPPACHSLSAT